MKTELQNQLVEKYPEFFTYLKDHTEGPIMPMSFGFECNDGWFTLIDTLMESIQNYVKWNLKGEEIQLIQVKEKFGGLRFYINGGNDMIRGMIWYAEALSNKTCEFCGTTNNIGWTQGWVFTICKDCFDAGKTNQKQWKSSEEMKVDKTEGAV
jgi:hypothetical protein